MVLFTLFALYLVGSRLIQEHLGFNHIEKGEYYVVILPVYSVPYYPSVTGVIADKIGYKLSLNHCFFDHDRLGII